jgi:hypothetical protein
MSPLTIALGPRPDAYGAPSHKVSPMNAATIRLVLRATLPFLADCLLPGLLAALNPLGKPGHLLSAERWLDGPGDALRVALTRQQWLAPCRCH